MTPRILAAVVVGLVGCGAADRTSSAFATFAVYEVDEPSPTSARPVERPLEPPPPPRPSPPIDAGVADASLDAGRRSTRGNRRDAGADARLDAGLDAGADGGVDVDGGVDAGPWDAGVDAGPPLSARRTPRVVARQITKILELSGIPGVRAQRSGRAYVLSAPCDVDEAELARILRSGTGRPIRVEQISRRGCPDADTTSTTEPGTTDAGTTIDAGTIDAGTTTIDPGTTDATSAATDAGPAAADAGGRAAGPVSPPQHQQNNPDSHGLARSR